MMAVAASSISGREQTYNLSDDELMEDCQDPDGKQLLAGQSAR
jgi:hypothetical protein